MVVEPGRHLFTADEYQRMGALGVLAPDQRLELLDGDMIEMTPIGPPHNGTVARLNEWFVIGVAGRAIVLVQGAFRLSDLSEPQPDLALLRRRDDFYTTSHPRPEDVLLLIEVSDSTARFDREVKRRLYAAAGVVETWIVDLPAQLVEVATDPSADGYCSVRQARPGEFAVPGAFPDLGLPVADLFRSGGGRGPR